MPTEFLTGDVQSILNNYNNNGQKGLNSGGQFYVQVTVGQSKTDAILIPNGTGLDLERDGYTIKSTNGSSILNKVSLNDIKIYNVPPSEMGHAQIGQTPHVYNGFGKYVSSSDQSFITVTSEASGLYTERAFTAKGEEMPAVDPSKIIVTGADTTGQETDSGATDAGATKIGASGTGKFEQATSMAEAKEAAAASAEAKEATETGASGTGKFEQATSMAEAKEAAAASAGATETGAGVGDETIGPEKEEYGDLVGEPDDKSVTNLDGSTTRTITKNWENKNNNTKTTTVATIHEYKDENNVTYRFEETTKKPNETIIVTTTSNGSLKTTSSVVCDEKGKILREDVVEAILEKGKDPNVTKTTSTTYSDDGKIVIISEKNSGGMSTTKITHDEKTGITTKVRVVEYKNEDDKWVRVEYTDEKTTVKIFETEDEMHKENGVPIEEKEPVSSLKAYSATSHENNVLGSKLSVVSNGVDAITNQIKAYNNVENSKKAKNEAAVIGAMYGASNYYGAITNNLYKNLSDEADAIYGIANLIFQMDKSQALIANDTLSPNLGELFGANTSGMGIELGRLDAASNALALSASDGFNISSRYTDLENILKNNLQPGQVGSVSALAISDVASSIINSLETEKANAIALKTSVTSFTRNFGAGAALEGEVWDRVKSNLQSYEDALDLNVKATEFLQEAITKATGIIAEYIDGCSEVIGRVKGTDFGSLVNADELDDSKVGDIESKLREIKIEIDNLNLLINKMENATKEQCNKDGTDCIYVKVYTEDQIKPHRDSLNKYIEARKALDDYVAKLKGLAIVMNAAQAIIADALNQIKDAYDNPTSSSYINNNKEFNLTVDLSAYGIDGSKDYKKILEGFIAKDNDEVGDGSKENPYRLKLSSSIEETEDK